MAFVYLVGSLSVIFYNYDNIIPSIVAIFGDLFTGSAASGGFLGATIAFAFNRGVNRGLFSNEAGQGSAPIAHAAAKAHEPVSEGMVAILEPFIDTILICSLTGVTLLSSGVWNEKHENKFQFSDLKVLSQEYDDTKEEDKKELGEFIKGEKEWPTFTGDVKVVEGKLVTDVSVIHARSLAENIEVIKDEKPYTGDIVVQNGEVKNDDIIMRGESLLHSAPLTALAFKRGFFGDYGEYIVTIGLLLFAFSTAIAWSYYGGRAINYLFGLKYVKYYRLFYVLMFFVASFTDTTIVWTFSGIAIAFMTLPNLFGILMLRKDMKDTVDKYWVDFEKEGWEKKSK
jgi:AGCS family alanine or glycine:cation symporter